MYFPEDMTFQYFFFDTYIGYFLQAIPFSLVASIIYYFIRYRKDKENALSQKIFSCIFVCYLTGLVCLVVGLKMMNIFWYNIFYPWDSGNSINWFGGSFDLGLDFFSNISGETIGNFLMFLPFGVLYPLSIKAPTLKKCVLHGLSLVAIIEILQPIFGRAFDINDVVLNSFGIVASTTAFMVIKKIFIKQR